MKKDFEKYLRTEKESFIKLIKQNKIQWNLTDKEVVVIEDFVIAYDQMYNELLSTSQKDKPVGMKLRDAMQKDFEKENFFGCTAIQLFNWFKSRPEFK